MRYISRKIQSILTLVVGSVFLALAGCGVSTDTGTDPNVPTILNSFSIVGNTNLSSPPVRIDLPMEGINTVDAPFHVTWDVSSSDPYSVVAHLSTDASVSLDPDDQILLDTQCGSLRDLYVCHSVFQQECGVAYEPDYEIIGPGPDLVEGTDDDILAVTDDHYYLRCNHGTATVDEIEITARMELVSFPAASLNNYIVFTFCNEAGDSCDTTSTLIQVYDANP